MDNEWENKICKGVIFKCGGKRVQIRTPTILAKCCKLILKNLHKGYFIYSPLRKTENHHSLPLEGIYIHIHVLIIQILDQLSVPAWQLINIKSLFQAEMNLSISAFISNSLAWFVNYLHVFCVREESVKEQWYVVKRDISTPKVAR